MPKAVSNRTYKYNDPFRPFTQLTWQLVASMISEDEATPEQIADLFNRDVGDVLSNLQKAYVSGRLAQIVRDLPQNTPEQSYRNLASRILADTYKDAERIKKASPKTAKANQEAEETAADIEEFIGSGWAETLCTTANIDASAYKNSVLRELHEFWQKAGRTLPKPNTLPSGLEVNGRKGN